MNKLFYPKLAFSNIKKNGKMYIPYLFASVFTIAMFYIMASLSQNESIREMRGGGSLHEILVFGTGVIGIFAVLVLFYANSFLMKRRKKELGLYHILGMEKKHIGIMLFVETLFISLFSIILGLFAGVLLSKLIYLVLLKMVNFDVSLQFPLSAFALIITFALFMLMFLVILLYNMLKVRLTNPINLLKGGQQGEKEPNTKWVIAIIGFVALGAAYFIALTIESPLDALSSFFIAVMLVIVGTFCLFIAGSIAVLKMLRKNKNYYYKSGNFTAISGMLYRMKQHAAGLASICILSTMVLVTISTTVSLYVGQEEIIETRFPQDFRINTQNPTEENISAIEAIVNEELQNYGLTAENLVSYTTEVTAVTGGDGKFTEAEDPNQNTVNDNMYAMYFMTEKDFNQVTGANYALEKNEVLLYRSKDYAYDTIELAGHTLNVVEKLDSNKEFEVMTGAVGVDTIILVVNNMDIVHTIFSNTSPIYKLGFDLPADEDTTADFTNTLRKSLENIEGVSVKSSQETGGDLLATDGGLFFLGIFLGFLFLMATGLIIYYKQISEGYEDRERFHIMQKVGMSKEEVKKTIRSQTLMVFFLPLIMSVIHLAFAFRIITKLLALFALTNTLLIFLCTIITILVFAVVYVILYRLTARAYYKIVS